MHEAAAETARWSIYQQAVFAAVKDPAGGNLVIEALAGSGKTTTLVEAVQLTEGRCLVVAFNTAIVEELQGRLPSDVDVRTLNSLGHRAVMQAFPQRRLEANYMRAIVAERVGAGAHNRAARQTVEKIIAAMKNTLTDWADLEAVYDLAARRLGVEFPATHAPAMLLELASQILCAREADELGGYTDEAPFNFDDQLWLPNLLDLPMPRDANTGRSDYDWVFVDEAQDLNLAQIKLLKKCLAPSGRIIAIGDRHQAIYGFRGADPKAIDRIVSEFAATVLPLSICYRCPASVIAEAQELVPAIEAAPDAPSGMVLNAAITTLYDQVRVGDLVLSRSNAPLVSLAFRWIRFGKPCYVRGRDVGSGLVTWIESRATNHPTIAALSRELETWHRRELERAEESDGPTELIDDTYNCLKLFLARATTPNEAAAAITHMFADTANGKNAITLSSVHRAKGTEAERVWLLRDTFCRESAMARNEREEKNLLYVAITRAKRSLFYVEYYEK
jgi:DNA helicase-2/ATP-dependent DNA helicase PcrA